MFVPNGDAPLWGDDLVARVATPRGALGPRTERVVDPRLVDGISWTGIGWRMDRDWDETVDGGYLDFGAATLELNDHEVVGFRIEVPEDTGAGHIIEGGGTAGHFQVTNPGRFPHNSYLRNVDLAYSYLLAGVVGDAIKVNVGTSTHRDAFIEMDVVPGGKEDKHYDGLQVFRSGFAVLDRVIIDWNGAGSIANTTGAIFTHDEASLTARDIVILNPGGTWQPVRLQATGVHDVDRMQVVGDRQPNRNQPEKLAPTALVRLNSEADRFVLYNDVPGAEDWLISDPED